MTLWKRTAAVTAAAMALGLFAVIGPASAQAPVTTTTHKTTHRATHGTTRTHKSFAQRHPVATSVAAGVAAHHIAKKTGQNRTAAGRNRNFAQRHPVATGVAAAAATHHVIKKHAKPQPKPTHP